MSASPTRATPDALVHAIYARLVFVEARLAELSRRVQPLLIAAGDHHEQPHELSPKTAYQELQESQLAEHQELQLEQLQQLPKQPQPEITEDPGVVTGTESAIENSKLPAEAATTVQVEINAQNNTTTFANRNGAWLRFDAHDLMNHSPRDILFSESEESDSSFARHVSTSPILGTPSSDWFHGTNRHPAMVQNNDSEKEEPAAKKQKGNLLPLNGKRRLYCHQFNRKDNCSHPGWCKYLHLCLRCDQSHAAVTCFKTPKERTQFLQKCIDW
ncbi:hypothetical protein HDU84_003010 [Entophlyctis sp. JEL0112]|nr:hypothetical protein HDU84_003010 [Entophlyctis sp. JEL0112]